MASTTLAGLHEVIQAAMGWEDQHLHCFRIPGRRYDGEYADLPRVLLADLRLRAGERFTYTYNHFAGWEHELRVSKRFSKKQSMRWTQAGAHLALQARTRVLNGELEDVFRRRWPGFQPPSKAEPDEAANSSFPVRPPPPVTAPTAHGS